MNKDKPAEERNSSLTVRVDKAGRRYVDTKELFRRQTVKETLEQLAKRYQKNSKEAAL